MTKLEQILLISIPVFLTAVLFAYIIYRQKVKRLRGYEHSLSWLTQKDVAGDWGEEYVQSMLVKNFDHVFCNKFVNEDREGEADAILFYNGHLLCIEVKDLRGEIFIKNGRWYKKKITRRGRRYTDSIKNLESKNIGNCIQLKEHLMKKTKKRVWVDSLLCFSDNSDIHELIEADMKVCYFDDVVDYIRTIYSKRGPVHGSIVRHLRRLPEWDVVETGGLRRRCYITNGWIELLNEAGNVVRLHTRGIASMKVRRSSRALRPDTVEVIFNDGRTKQFHNYKGRLNIKGEDSPVSLSRVKSVTFGRRG